MWQQAPRWGGMREAQGTGLRHCERIVAGHGGRSVTPIYNAAGRNPLPRGCALSTVWRTKGREEKCNVLKKDAVARVRSQPLQGAILRLWALWQWARQQPLRKTSHSQRQFQRG
ncbi:hypothetical protein ACINB_24170 [Acidovorax sp. NB1]|nr:hypothetical protein ACINB_24170 [Acidovorax sp. NB1]